MERAFLGLILAAILGVTLMLAPLTLLRSETSVERFDEARPKAPKGAETLAVPEDRSAGVDWFNLAPTVILGAIPAAVIYIFVKRKMRI